MVNYLNYHYLKIYILSKFYYFLYKFYGIYPDYSGGKQLSRISHILYQSTSRIIWSIGLSYIIYACATSNGGLINKLLSLNLWIPLSRLTFSAYLIHSTLIYNHYYSQDHPIHGQDSIMVY